MKRRTVGEWIAYSLGGVLLIAVGNKLLSSGMAPDGPVWGLEAFAHEIARHGVIPHALAPAVAWSAVLSEIALGLALVASLRPRLALIALIAVLAAYAGYLLAAYRVNPATRCACFGAIGPADLRLGVGRNLAMMLAAAAAIRLLRCPGVPASNDGGPVTGRGLAA